MIAQLRFDFLRLSKAQTVSLGENRDGAEVSVELISGDNLADRSIVSGFARQERRQFAKIVLEPGR